MGLCVNVHRVTGVQYRCPQRAGPGLPLHSSLIRKSPAPAWLFLLNCCPLLQGVPSPCQQPSWVGTDETVQVQPPIPLHRGPGETHIPCHIRPLSVLGLFLEPAHSSSLLLCSYLSLLCQRGKLASTLPRQMETQMQNAGLPFLHSSLSSFYKRLLSQLSTAGGTAASTALPPEEEVSSHREAVLHSPLLQRLEGGWRGKAAGNPRLFLPPLSQELADSSYWQFS